MSNELKTGVLLTNKTFGRGKLNKLLYKCVYTKQKEMYSCLIPYELKASFGKDPIRLFILFNDLKEKEKDEQNGHTYGKLVETIGKVTDLKAFNEYQWYCAGFGEKQYSIQPLQQHIYSQIKKSPQYLSNPKFKKRNNETGFHIFSIDGSDTQDYDDAFSVKYMDNVIMVSIYIANVPLFLDKTDCWDKLSDRVSTLYLSTSKKPMLPFLISENMCSLKKGETKMALTLDIYIDLSTNTLIKTEYNTFEIQVTNNFIYEDTCLLSDRDYQTLFNLTKTHLSKQESMNPFSVLVKDSFSLVEFWMIFMNVWSAKTLKEQNTGIFRHQKNGPITEIIDDKLIEILPRWITTQCSAEYSSDTKHELSTYLHITSPIRRLVDVLNMIQIMPSEFLSEQAHQFYEKWIHKINDINCDMKTIKKIQRKSQLLQLFSTKEGQTNNNETIYDAFIISLDMNNNMNNNKNKVEVYIPLLSHWSSIKVDELQKLKFKLYSQVKVQAFFFDKKDTLTQKIKFIIL